MKTYFDGFSDKQMLDWYHSWCKSYTKNHPFPEGQGNTIASGQRNDVFNVYAYGDTIKIVYIKNGKKFKKTDEISHFKKDETKPLTEKEKSLRFSQSISRSKARIFELAMCNEFQFFCTFTQDKTKRDRFDLFEFRKDFSQFIRNQNRFRAENEKIKYLLIPEQHKDGAWHMHGLLQGLTENDLKEFTLKDHIPKRIKDQIRNGERVFDWLKYRNSFGFFTCTAIKETGACARYITKYVSKDLQRTVHESGEHLFFASKGLKGREVILKNCYEQCPVSEWDFENDYVKVKEVEISSVPFMGQ